MSELEDLKERLQKVEAENAKFRHVLEVIDRDIDRAAIRYIKSPVPHGKLPFHQFLALLELEMKRKFMDQRSTPEGFRFYVNETVWNMLNARIEQVIQSMLPKIEGEISKFIKLPVLIKPAKKLGIGGKQLKYQAVTVKGVLKPGLGESPEAAYADLRDRLVVHLKEKPTSVFTRDPAMMVNFNQSKPFSEEVLGGWTIEARIRV